MNKTRPILIIFVVLLLSLFPNISISAPSNQIRLIFATHLPDTNDKSVQMKYFQKLVTERTGGKVSFRNYYSETLGKASELLALNSKGGCDLAFLIASYYPADFRLLSLVNIIFQTEKIDAQQKAVLELFQKFPAFGNELETKNLKPLIITPSDISIIGLNKRLDTPADLKGLRIRAGSWTTNAVKAWGGVPVSMSSSDMYEALQRRIIDGFTQQPLSAAATQGLHEVCKNFVDVGIGLYSTGFFTINKNKWAQLPDDVRKIMEKAAQETMEIVPQTAMDISRKFIPKILAAGVQIYRVSPQAMKEFQEARKGVEEAWVAQVTARGKGVDEKNARAALAEMKTLIRKFEVGSKFKTAFDIYEKEFKK
jgi:TRAP-type C4-dicarboxylate transport system substrate-binding protein